MNEQIAIPCPWCGHEGYDNVYLRDGVARHGYCGKPVEYTIRNRIAWTLHRWFRGSSKPEVEKP